MVHLQLQLTPLHLPSAYRVACCVLAHADSHAATSASSTISAMPHTSGASLSEDG